ncbi:MAG: DUF1840 domain-containing protein [Alphaproteobacteria bacterium]|nr:DUF1840 domain-containing protein [Alphaproteobacteria bacterium]
MLYKFKSKATGDLIMLEPHGRMILQIIGKEPEPKGILKWGDMPTAMQALQQAIDDQESRAREQQVEGDEREISELVSLRQRALPFMEMLRRCLAQKCDLVWGV